MKLLQGIHPWRGFIIDTTGLALPRRKKKKKTREKVNLLVVFELQSNLLEFCLYKPHKAR